MSLVNRNYFVLAIVLCLLVLQEAMTKAISTDDTTEAILSEVNVDIANKLPNGATFTIHCKSGNDDLGTHVIGAGKSYGFSFKINVTGSTLFFCGVSWQGGQVEFDIYNTSRDDGKRCSDECKWLAKEDAVVGFNFIGTGPNPDIVIPWQK
ncbi:S-protein homolog 5-like [Punica granatum]|uniref:S-protein homolog n=1 Tax=Punica granatum TaxID=22663 RepID=A0A6P8BXA7_PUNGR|nr:S-protein homolog 5-like [Punica granatum]